MYTKLLVVLWLWSLNLRSSYLINSYYSFDILVFNVHIICILCTTHTANIKILTSGGGQGGGRKAGGGGMGCGSHARAGGRRRMKDIKFFNDFLVCF